ncbi:hypothetical protein ACFLX5_04145 [Chloroflexota bacterium]
MNYVRRQLSSLSGALLANGLATFFYILFRVLYDIRVRGLQNYSASAPTLITINHKRDLDILIIASTLHLHKTFFKPKLRTWFVARDDLFAPGFLSAHFPIPWPLGKLAHRTNIGPIMRALRAYPMSHLVHKRIGPLLRDVIQLEGDHKLGKIVKPKNLEEFAKLLGIRRDSYLDDLLVSDFLGYDYCRIHQRMTDVGILQGELSRKVRAYSLDKVEQQLQLFASILDDGNICLLAPEGHLSPDGRFWPVKSGLHRLLSMTRADVRVFPVNTTYDFMTSGRMRVHITIGEEMVGLKKLRKVELERQVQKNIVSLGPVTLGQLGSQYILNKLHSGHKLVYEDDLVRDLFSHAQTLKDRGLVLDDRLIQEKGFRRRLREFIGYCLAKRILTKAAPGTFLIDRDLVLNATGCNHWENPVQYSSNELHSLEEMTI